MREFVAMDGKEALILVAAASASRAVEKFSKYLHGSALDKWLASKKTVVEWVTFSCPHCNQKNQGLVKTAVICQNNKCRQKIEIVPRTLF